MNRIEPLHPPYDDATAAQLAMMTPPGVPPILLFRTFVTNLPMARAMSTWGRYELSGDLSISMREREIVIDRTCAACGCEYEWGVHVAVFAERVGLDAEQLASLTHGSADDPCWSAARERALIRAVDSLHATADLDDDRYAELAAELSDTEILDVLLLCGWYHAISYAANAARVQLEPGAPRFADVRESPARTGRHGVDV
jgi:alkylhydroperoxidase family enzyme